MNEPEWWPKVQKTAQAYGVTERDRQNIEAILSQAHHGLTPIRSVQLEHFLIMGYEAGVKAIMNLQRAVAWDEGYRAGYRARRLERDFDLLWNPYLIPVSTSGDGVSQRTQEEENNPDDQQNDADGHQNVEADDPSND